MFTAKVVFSGPLPKERREAAIDLAHSYLAFLLKNGQVVGDYLIDWCAEGLIAYVRLPRPDAFERRFLSQYGRESLERISRELGGSPAWSILSDQIPKRFPALRSAKFLYLRTYPLEDRSPVCRGDDGVSIPTYLLPVSGAERESIFFWLRSYRQHEELWIESHDLEIPAYRQMATLGSHLGKWGRKLCRAIERGTGIKTYYYLFKYYGRDGDQDRPCPSCGRRWRLPPERQSFRDNIQFLCERCRLVSTDGDDWISPRFSRIGEYRGSPPPRRRQRSVSRRS